MEKYIEGINDKKSDIPSDIMVLMLMKEYSISKKELMEWDYETYTLAENKMKIDYKVTLINNK